MTCSRVPDQRHPSSSTVMAIGALIETVVPMFVADAVGGDGRRGANLWLDGTVVRVELAAGVAGGDWPRLTLRPAGLHGAGSEWPVWLEIVVGIVVLDFSVGYVSHRTMHMWPAMWRFHQIHHSDPFVDVTTTYRTASGRNGLAVPASRSCRSGCSAFRRRPSSSSGCCRRPTASSSTPTSACGRRSTGCCRSSG